MLASKIKEIKNGRVIVKDSKIRDANPDGTISPDEEKRMAELLREANESKSRLKAKAYEIGGSFRGPGNWKRVKSILTSDSKTKDKYDLVWQNDKYEVYEDENREFELVRKSDKSVVGQYATLQGAKLEASESSKVDAHLSKMKDVEPSSEQIGKIVGLVMSSEKDPTRAIAMIQNKISSEFHLSMEEREKLLPQIKMAISVYNNSSKDSKTKDAKTKHEYKGYVLEWDNENSKVPAKIISPKGKIIFTYAIGAQPTITGFNSKVELDLSKTKDGEAEESFIKANLASGKIDYIAAAKELMSLGYSQPDAMRTVRIWLGNDAMHAVRQMR